MAQQAVRIGNLEFTVRKQEQDTTLNVLNEPCPPCPPQNQSQRTPIRSRTRTTFFMGAGFVLPDYSNDYYTALGSKSFNIDAGWSHRHLITRWLGVGGSIQYSFLNYNLRDAVSVEEFKQAIVDGREFDDNDVRKQDFRSHNIAASAFTRFYLSNYQNPNSNNRTRLDLGVHGDVSVNKYFLLNTRSEGKKRYYEDYAFNPFTVSAFARLGFGALNVYARYRLTDVFNSDVLQMDLPPATFGVQIHFK